MISNRNLLIIIIGTAILLMPSFTMAATTTSSYSMKVVVSMPTGSDGATLSTTMPSNTKISPCSTTAGAKVNQVSFTVTYNAGTVPDKDIYLILFNPEHDMFLTIEKQPFPNPNITMSSYDSIEKLNDAKADCIYISKSQNTGGSVTENLFNIILTGADGIAGTWQLIGIVADSSSVDFDDPSTWAAWDTATFMIRKPWIGTNNTSCQGSD